MGTKEPGAPPASGNVSLPFEINKSKKLTADTLKSLYHTSERGQQGTFPLGASAQFHSGTDLLVERNKPVLSIAGGEVVAARIGVGPGAHPWGDTGLVLLRHPLQDNQTVYSLFVHLQREPLHPDLTQAAWLRRLLLDGLVPAGKPKWRVTADVPTWKPEDKGRFSPANVQKRKLLKAGVYDEEDRAGKDKGLYVKLKGQWVKASKDGKAQVKELSPWAKFDLETAAKKSPIIAALKDGKVAIFDADKKDGQRRWTVEAGEPLGRAGTYLGMPLVHWSVFSKGAVFATGSLPEKEFGAKDEVKLKELDLIEERGDVKHTEKLIEALDPKKKSIGKMPHAIPKPGEVQHFYRTPAECWRSRYLAVKGLTEFALDVDKFLQQERHKSHTAKEREEFKKSTRVFIFWKDLAKADEFPQDGKAIFVHPATAVRLIRPVPVPRLAVLGVDPNFAPGEEKLEVRYSISDLSDKPVRLQVLSDRYPGKVLLERELTRDEKADGDSKSLSWDGRIGVGDRKGRFASPSLSPFRVKLAGGAKASEAEFQILVHSLECKLGDFERGIFDDAADTTKGQQQRLKQLGYYHGDLSGSAGDAKFKKAVEWFQSEYDPAAPAKGVVGESTREALRKSAPKCVEGGALPAAGAKAKVFVSGALFYATDADLNPGGHPRFQAEKAFWGDGLRIPVYAKIYLKKKDGSRADCPKSVWGTRVLFDYTDPADDAVLTGNQKDYCAKALDYEKKKTIPKGDNCHKDRGGKRGDGIVHVFPESADTSKFPCKVAKAQHREATVVATAREEDDDLQGQAGVVFCPSRMGGDAYVLRAYLHTEWDLDTDSDKVTAPDVEIKTGSLYVWRRVRVNQYLHKPNAAINAIDMATVNVEMAKAYMEFTGELVKKDLDEPTWNAKVTAALTSDADFATIGVVDYVSLNTIDFKTYAQYHAAGGALPAAAYTALCRNKTAIWLGRIMSGLAADQFHGMTVIRVANGHAAYFTNSGLAPIGPGCFVWWPKATYDAKSYVVEKYAQHEMGHCLYLRHHYTAGATSGAPATWPASDNPDDHDADDPGCAMSYYRTDWHLCGKCILKLRGWDESVLSKDDDANRKV